MNGSTRVAKISILIGLALLEYFIYFWHAGHFFQADTIYWFYHRLHSFGEFARSFATPDPGGWYRPLTNRTVQSMLYPVLGLNPAGFRWVQYVMFFADTLAVFALTSKLTKKDGAAAIAAVFFSIHTINAYTTYDLSFMPELTYTFLYICATLAFFRFLETQRRRDWIVSVVLFGLSLCSKESAVTLPLTLIVAATIAGFRMKTVLRNVVPHAILLGAYLMLTLGRLGVASEALASLHTPPVQLDVGGYYFMPGPHIFVNAATAWSWALNLPVGMLGQWRDLTRSRSIVLWGFAGVQMLLIIYTFARGAWRPVLAGFAWFWITILPALPLMGHFLPYYLFLPIAGFSIIVGATWSRLHPAVVVVTFALLVLVCGRTARSEARNNFLLGRSSRIAEASLQDMRRMYPSIPPDTTFFINDDAQPDLPFHHADGGLFRLAYADESLQFKYASTKAVPSDAMLKLVYKDGHLTRLN